MGELYKSVTELMKTARGNKALQGNLGDITDFQQIIDDTPTADVVEVIRCKDCKHYFGGKCYVTNHSPHFYDVNIHSRKKDDFCSYGAKMDGGKV